MENLTPVFRNGDTITASIDKPETVTSKDYSELINKPKINDVELNGNKNFSDFNPSYNDLNDKPEIPDISGLATKEELEDKVDKENGKSLTTNDLTDTLKSEYDSAYQHSLTPHFSGNYDDLTNKPTIPDISGLAEKTEVESGLAEKVDKVNGKGLSENDLTDTLKENYDTAYQHSQTAHFSGDYNDLTNKPTIPTIPASLPADGGNADTVNNHTVNADVPADAKFTDTVYTLPTASTTEKGGVKVDGSTIVIDENGVISSTGGGGGGYTLPKASTTTLGGVKIDGETITIDEDGVIRGSSSYTLPAATESALGGVKSGGDISVASDGSVTVNKVNGETLSAVATSNDYNDLDNKPAIPTIPTNVSAFTNDAGYLTEHQDISGKANIADLSAVATSGSYDDLDDKPEIPAPYTLPKASTSTLGGVKVDGTTVTINDDGVISAIGGGVVVKTDIPELVGTYTFNGSEITAEWNNYNEEEITASGVLAATNAGTYTASFSPKTGYIWSDGTSEIKSISWTIERAVVSTVPSQSGKLKYTGSELIPAWNDYDSDKLTIGGQTSGTEVGTYTATFTPTANYKWDNDTITAKSVEWTISQAYRIMTVKIDLSNSNPATCCTYHDDAADMVAGSSDWEEFFGVYPVLLKNGSEVGELNPNNFAQFANGTAADITSGNAGDVMICFPRRGLKISTAGNIVTASMTDDPDNANFSYYAHTKGTERKEKFYLGAYKGYYDGSKLRSLSGKTITANQTIGTFRTYAQANGAGYEQSGFYQLVFRQVMYLLKYKNLNSQAAVGRGFVDGNSAATTTGNTNTKGMTWGETTGKLQMKLFGLEDFWGNVYEWIDGLITDASYNMLTATTGFNDSGSGYTNQGKGASANLANYMSKPQGTTETGFIAKEVSGSETTYFCDYACLSASRLAIFGGYWYNASDAGAFMLHVRNAASAAYASIAARLMYL